MKEKCSTAELAKLLGVTPRRVLQLVTEGVLKKIARDRFEVSVSVQAYVEFIKRTAASEAGRYAGLSRERAGLVKAQREMAEVELDERLGNTVLINDAQEIIARCLVTVKHRLLALGAKLGPLANPGSPTLAREVIYGGIVEVLGELSALETYGRAEEHPPAVLAQ